MSRDFGLCDSPTCFAVLCVLSRSHKLNVLNKRADELAAWEHSKFERGVMVTATYMLACVAIALFVFMNIIFSVRFSASDNRMWLVTVIPSIVLGPCEVCLLCSFYKHWCSSLQDVILTVVLEMFALQMCSWCSRLES